MAFPYTIRSRTIGVAVAVALLGTVIAFRRCDPPAPPYSYTGHERPRVFASHHPLLPIPGQHLTISLAPDGGDAQSGSATLSIVGGSSQTQSCTGPTGGPFTCDFTL